MAAEAATGQSAPAQPELPAGGPAAAGAQKGKGRLLIVAVIGLLLLAGGVALYFFVFRAEKRDMVVSDPEEVKFIELYNLRKQESIDQIRKTSNPIFSDIYSYTANLRDGQHMMRFSFRAKLFDTAAKEYLKGIRPSIDDMMLQLLKNLSAEDLRNRSGLELLKRTIHRLMNEMYTQQFIEQSSTRDRMPIKEILIVEYHLN